MSFWHPLLFPLLKYNLEAKRINDRLIFRELLRYGTFNNSGKLWNFFTFLHLLCLKTSLWSLFRILKFYMSKIIVQLPQLLQPLPQLPFLKRKCRVNYQSSTEYEISEPHVLLCIWCDVFWKSKIDQYHTKYFLGKFRIVGLQI